MQSGAARVQTVYRITLSMTRQVRVDILWIYDDRKIVHRYRIGGYCAGKVRTIAIFQQLYSNDVELMSYVR